MASLAAIRVLNGATRIVVGFPAIRPILRGNRGKPIAIPRNPFWDLIADTDPPNLGLYHARGGWVDWGGTWGILIRA